jgi:hypothetical protein
MLPVVLAVLLGACGLVIIMGPLFAAPSAGVPGDDLASAELIEREATAKAALRDVEFDYQLGNLAAGDYRTLRDRYTRRALAAMKRRYDRERSVDELIEAEVRQLRAREATGTSTSLGHRAASCTTGPQSRTHKRAARGEGTRRNDAMDKSGKGRR